MVPAQKASYGHFVRVLICDDEPDIRLLYRGAFEDAGADVDEAGDGNEAIEVAGRVQPDIVVLDLYMPNRDGFSALAELRRLLPATRVIIVSAHAAVEVFDRGRALGATACFDKVSFLRRIPLVIDKYGSAA